MTSSNKKIIVKFCVVVFAITSIYFSYGELRTNEKVQSVFASIVSKTPIQNELEALVHENTESIQVESVVSTTNAARLATDPTLVVLTVNEALTRSAQAKVDDMVAKGYFEHETPEGYNVEYFIDNAGYEYITVAENLASGDFADAQALVDAWMNSPGHRANILNKDVVEIGVAVSYVEFQGRMQYVAVQHFGRPKSSCPSTNEALNASILANEAKLEAMEADLAELKAKIDSEGPGSREYEDDINEYNTLVNSYNALSKSLQNDIATYNESVRAFNACIGSAEVSSH